MQQLIGWPAVVLMERPLGTDESDAGQQPRPTILARYGAAKPPYLAYLPSEVTRLHNRAGHVYIRYHGRWR